MRLRRGNANAPARAGRALAAAIAACTLVLAVASTRAAELPGLGRVTASGWLDGLAVVDTGGGARQRPQLLGQVAFDAAPARALRARATLRGRVGGPFEGGSGPCVYDFSRTFQNCSPAVEAVEAWLEWRTAHADVRGGIQQLAWGKLDGIPPTDVIDPRGYHDPFVDEVEERKIGVGALAGTFYLPDAPRLELSGLRVQLLWVPFAVPPRLPLIEERWFPSATQVPDRFVLPRAIDGVTLPDRTVRVDFGTANDAPPRTLAESGGGLRVGGTLGRADWDLYHYTGPVTGPYVALEAVLVNRGTLAAPDLLAFADLTQRHGTVHMTGADWAMPLGDFTLRAEAAWLVDQPVLRATSAVLSPDALQGLPVRRILRQLAAGRPAPVPLAPVFPQLDLVDWGVGVDTIWNGWQPILQLNQIVPLDDVRGLLIADPETRLTGVVRKRLWDERIELELRTVWAIEKGAWVAFPRVSWLVRDDLRLRVGYLAIGGPKRSVYGQYKGNDEVVFQARWSF